MPSGTKPTPGLLSRTVGAILRSRMARLDISTLELAVSVGISRPQLSKMLRGVAHIDIEQFTALCTRLDLDSARVLDEAIVEADSDTENNRRTEVTELSPAEVSRRLSLLTEFFDDHDDGYYFVSSKISHVGTGLNLTDWRAALAGGNTLDYRTLSAVAEALGVPVAYLTRDDHEVVDRVEAELVLSRALADAGTTRIAARGQLSPDTLREIAALVSRRISK